MNLASVSTISYADSNDGIFLLVGRKKIYTCGSGFISTEAVKGLQTSDFRLRTSDFRLRTLDFGFQTLRIKISNRRVTQRCNVSANMRNATCARTEASKLPT